MALPIVTAADQTVLLGTTVELGDLFTVSDSDGDSPTRLQIRDNNNNINSGYFTFNGVVQPPNTLLTYNYSDLNLLVYHSGTAITKEQIDIRVEAGGQWSDYAKFLLYTVKENLNRPVISVSDRTVVQSELISISDSVSFNDPDGYPVARWRVRDRNPGQFSGKLVLNGSVLAPVDWHYIEIADFANLIFTAAFSAPNNDVIDIRGFDGVDWSFVTTFNSFTALNFNRPVVLPSEYQMATEETVAMKDLFSVSDADNNTIKKLRFWDVTPHSWSGHMTIDGIEQPANKFIEVNFADLSRMEWYSSSRSFNEQIRVMAFDGNHWSDIQTIRVRTNEKPVISVSDDYSIREELLHVNVPALVVKLDDGPVYTKYELYDSSPNSLSGTFRNGALVLPALQVHNVTPTQFQGITFKTGVHEVRSLDEIYVRAFNGTFWSDWTRHTVRTEPDYIESLAAESWLNYLAPASDGRLKLTFSFMETYPDYMQGEGAIPDEFVRPWIEMRDLVRQSFVRMSELIKVDYEEVNDHDPGIFGQGGIIRIGTYCLISGTAAYAFFPGTAPINGDMMFNRFNMGGPISPPPPDPPCPSSSDPYDAWDVGDFNYFVFFHEFGHAMGLSHPFDTPIVLPVSTDTNDFSVMSYTPPTNGRTPQGPMLYDIAALHEIYGANSFNTGNTVYNRAYFRNAWDMFDAIWDTGGNDTIDASDVLTDTSIDLRPGSFQSIGGLQNNLVIAFNVEIENATTGAGSDTLIGNESVNRLIAGAGNDTFNGYAGDDFLSGQAGNDTYNYKMFDGRDLIDEANGAGRDTVDVGLFLGLNNFTDDLSFTKTGNDLIIDFTIDDGISRGQVRIKNQAFGGYRIEEFEVLGQTIDLKYLYSNITTPGQQFAVTATMGQYGLLVAPA